MFTTPVVPPTPPRLSAGKTVTALLDQAQKSVRAEASRMTYASLVKAVEQADADIPGSRTHRPDHGVSMTIRSRCADARQHDFGVICTEAELIWSRGAWRVCSVDRVQTTNRTKAQVAVHTDEESALRWLTSSPGISWAIRPSAA